MKVYALIPARSGSKGLPHKNIREIDGHPLLAYAVSFGRALGIDKVILSTDSEDYAAIGRRYGADVPFLRGEAASGDTAMEEMIVAEFAEKFPQIGWDLPDIWVRLKPTNPFRRVESVHQALATLRDRPEVTSARITCKAEARLLTTDAEGYLTPLLQDMWDPGRSVMRRTEFPEAYLPFNLDIFRHAEWERRGSAYMGDKIWPLVDHPITGIDINDLSDFELVQTLIEARPRPPIVAAYTVTPEPLAP